jgi:hypothetical protein
MAGNYTRTEARLKSISCHLRLREVLSSRSAGHATAAILDGSGSIRLGGGLALAVIWLWYLGIGVLAAIGAVKFSRARFSPRTEHIFFALLLIPIAAMYLAFLAYFGDHAALRLEAYAVALFAALGLSGLRLPALLLLGYALHGAWDLIHEVLLYHGPASAGARSLTAIPLAYGVFCAVFDWCMAAYFFTRQAVWRR